MSRLYFRWREEAIPQNEQRIGETCFAVCRFVLEVRAAEDEPWRDTYERDREILGIRREPWSGRYHVPDVVNPMRGTREGCLETNEDRSGLP